MRPLLLFVSALMIPASVLAANPFASFKGDIDPVTVGNKVCKRFVETPHPNFDANPQPTREITYPETCAWLGALRYAEKTGDTVLVNQLEQRFLPIVGEERRLQPLPDHVDHSVFGTIPLQLYILTGNPLYHSMGRWYADAQWNLPVTNDEKRAAKDKEYSDKGLSWQTRYWIDDMFMISALQGQAYRATGDKKYIDRAAHEMVDYLGKIQCPNGLFYHAEDAPFHWCRGNGWMAAGMTELLSLLPEDNQNRDAIMNSFRKMMETLAGYQKPDGLWAQLVDDPSVWSETSGSAMFLYAMISGVKNGWLPAKKYMPIIEKGWKGLVSHINSEGDIDGVCEGTNRTNDRDFYLNRRTLPGNMHGQAPVIWCATAMID
ncbi:MAG: glycoside hydrolase family 88 protein [Muribaculaceae bacterium]|nr:glycoside hydrolase family 88 protein [Muribaculaceae bacterium]